MTQKLIYTIGHSTHEWTYFLKTIISDRIDEIADVRSTPYSEYSPQFNREGLQDSLQKAGKSYIFLGKELGGRSIDPKCYISGKVQYELVARTPLFAAGMDRLCDLAAHRSIGILCSEKDPITCHRTILVARHLVARGKSVSHILEDGSIESNAEAMQRVIEKFRLLPHESDLFGNRISPIDEAYALQGQAIAYSEKSAPKHPANGGAR